MSNRTTPRRAFVWARVHEVRRARIGVVIAFLLTFPRLAAAEVPFAQRLTLHYSAGASLMFSSDQREWLGYSAPGLLSDLQLGLRLSPLLAAQIGVAGGVFFSPQSNGAVLAPMLGATLHWTLLSVPMYAALNLGAAVTGVLLRPFGRALFGIDWSLSSQFRAGPVLGLDVVTQIDGPLYSNDAIYGWVGLGLSYRPVVGRDAPKMLVREPVEELEPEPAPVLPPSAAEPEPEQAPIPFELAREHEPPPPSHEINSLIEEAVHLEHSELLAPVLFEYDSIELEPSSVAMLHEVARLLIKERRDILLLGVIAYSDARGSERYNLALSGRRAQHVRDWLVAHGVESERLIVEARGATEPVETGEQADHQQNRRVVFRILRAESRP